MNRTRLNIAEAEEFRDLGGTVQILSDRLAATQGFLAVGRFEPGEGLRRHYHEPPGEEFYYVIRGSGTVWLGAETFEVTAGDAVCVLPGVVHGVTNSGTQVLEIVFAISPKSKAAPIES
jgi:quercetin dioxygenase-like cupin family protein